jgi:hypothetical protein
MKREDIRKHVVAYVKEEVTKGIEKQKTEYNLLNYCTMSHNLYHFLPSVSGDEHWEIYKNILVNRALSSSNDYFQTFDYKHLLPHITKEHLQDYLPGIIAAFHFSERSGYFIPLIRESINFVIITGYIGEGLKQKCKQVKEEVEFTKRYFPDSTTKVELLSYKSKTLFVDLIKKIKEGYSIMWFQDWADKYVNPIECETISFLNKQILVPKGMAIFSAMTRCSIIPWFAFYGTDMQPDCYIGNILTPQSIPFKEYVKYAMQELYHELEKNVTNHYREWEGWFNIHRFTTGGSISTSQKAIIDLSSKNIQYNKLSSIFKIRDKCFIMNRKSGKLIEIDDRIRHIIEGRNFSKLTDNEFEILSRNEILI